MIEWCAIAGWGYYCGLVRMHVRLMPRGAMAIAVVHQMLEWRLTDITVDTANDGVFKIETHEIEFYEWCKAVPV